MRKISAQLTSPVLDGSEIDEYEKQEKKKGKTKYYSLTNILKFDAHYNIVIGKRSNGKTYSGLEYMLVRHLTLGEKGAYIRRWDEDFRSKRGKQLFDGLIDSGCIQKISKGKFNRVLYKNHCWYLANYDAKKGEYVEIQQEPFCYAFALSMQEHEKSTAYPKVETIIFDEFITRGSYLPDEFMSFMNLISTIVRKRDTVKIFMFANTVNKYSPYFADMGLTNVKEQKQGTIELYQAVSANNLVCKIAVEYCKENEDKASKGDPSDVYFCFNNPKLSMITTGAWEIPCYPHLPLKYKSSQIIDLFFIVFDDEILQCELIDPENNTDIPFIYVHRKTTPIQLDNEKIVYSQEYTIKGNYRRKLLKPQSEYEKKIAEIIVRERIFFQDNETGEIFRNYLEWSKNDKGVQ